MSKGKPTNKLLSVVAAHQAKPGIINKSKGSRAPPQLNVRSTFMSSASHGSKKSTQFASLPGVASSSVRTAVQVFDEQGNDVTPLPLLTVDPSQVRLQQGGILGDSSVATPTDLMSQMSASFMTASVYGGGPFSRSVFSHSYDTSESVPDEGGEVGADTSTWTEIRQRRPDVKEVLHEGDLDKIVDITLEETETIWMLDIPTVCVALDSEEADNIRIRNDLYKELCKSRAGNDLYAERGMNTFNQALKFKAIQTTKITFADQGVSCSNWELYDTYAAQEKESKGTDEDDEEGTISRPSSPKDSAPGGPKPNVTVTDSEGKESAKDINSRGESRGTMSSSVAGSELFSSKETVFGSIQSDLIALEEERIMKSEQLKKDLFIMERVINLNTYQPKQALYRGFKIITGETESQSNINLIADMGPNLDRLWSYYCPLTKGRNVSCLTWNKSNPDLIAVGYGQFEFTAQKSGLICCWSLKNPEYPERVYTSKHGVTALDFSVANANILAAGYYDGGVAIYNVRKTEDKPVLDNQESGGKHLGPVWQIQWIEKERGSGEEKAEVVITISTDGRVTQWSIRKGFECYDIMKLKKMPTRMTGRAREKKGEAFISRQSGGLCFDFHYRDFNVYLAGTEEGYIHKCSCSYNEQYLETYSGHTAPVYRIRWSPFVPDIFLSCSADWSIRLWHQDRTSPILTFHSSTKAVHDVCWSPRSSTVFACVNEGAVEVWDLSLSTLDAAITVTPTSGAKLTSVTFSRNTECLLVGDNEGQVTVYELRSMPPPPEPEAQVETLNNVIKASIASQLTTIQHELTAPSIKITDDTGEAT